MISAYIQVYIDITFVPVHLDISLHSISSYILYAHTVENDVQSTIKIMSSQESITSSLVHCRALHSKLQHYSLVNYDM